MSACGLPLESPLSFISPLKSLLWPRPYEEETSILGLFFLDRSFPLLYIQAVINQVLIHSRRYNRKIRY